MPSARTVSDAHLTDALRADARLQSTGIEILGVQVLAVRPESDVERALQTPVREQLQAEADRAVYERRAVAVERERTISENEMASQIELAEKVGLSPTACARRIRQLEETGIIRGYRADLEPTALGLVTTVIVTITLEKQSEEYLAAFEAAIARCPDVVSCHLMSGSDDYHLQVIARDIADFERIHKQHLSRMPGVARIHSSFAMREVVRRAIPETALQR